MAQQLNETPRLHNDTEDLNPHLTKKVKSSRQEGICLLDPSLLVRVVNFLSPADLWESFIVISKKINAAIELKKAEIDCLNLISFASQTNKKKKILSSQLFERLYLRPKVIRIDFQRLSTHSTLNWQSLDPNRLVELYLGRLGNEIDNNSSSSPIMVDLVENLPRFVNLEKFILHKSVWVEEIKGSDPTPDHGADSRSTQVLLPKNVAFSSLRHLEIVGLSTNNWVLKCLVHLFASCKQQLDTLIIDVTQQVNFAHYPVNEFCVDERELIETLIENNGETLKVLKISNCKGEILTSAQQCAQVHTFGCDFYSFANPKVVAIMDSMPHCDTLCILPDSLNDHEGNTFDWSIRMSHLSLGLEPSLKKLMENPRVTNIFGYLHNYTCKMMYWDVYNNRQWKQFCLCESELLASRVCDMESIDKFQSLQGYLFFSRSFLDQASSKLSLEFLGENVNICHGGVKVPSLGLSASSLLKRLELLGLNRVKRIAITNEDHYVNSAVFVRIFSVFKEIQTLSLKNIRVYQLNSVQLTSNLVQKLEVYSSSVELGKSLRKFISKLDGLEEISTDRTFNRMEPFPMELSDAQILTSLDVQLSTKLGKFTEFLQQLNLSSFKVSIRNRKLQPKEVRLACEMFLEYASSICLEEFHLEVSHSLDEKNTKKLIKKVKNMMTNQEFAENVKTLSLDIPLSHKLSLELIDIILENVQIFRFPNLQKINGVNIWEIFCPTPQQYLVLNGELTELQKNKIWMRERLSQSKISLSLHYHDVMFSAKEQECWNLLRKNLTSLQLLSSSSKVRSKIFDCFESFKKLRHLDLSSYDTFKRKTLRRMSNSLPTLTKLKSLVLRKDSPSNLFHSDPDCANYIFEAIKSLKRLEKLEIPSGSLETIAEVEQVLELLRSNARINCMVFKTVKNSIQDQHLFTLFECVWTHKAMRSFWNEDLFQVKMETMRDSQTFVIEKNTHWIMLLVLLSHDLKQSQEIEVKECKSLLVETGADLYQEVLQKMPKLSKLKIDGSYLSEGQKEWLKGDFAKLLPTTVTSFSI